MLTICTSRTTGAQDAGGYTVPGLTALPRRLRYLLAIGNAQVPRYGSCEPAGTSHTFGLITGDSSAGISFVKKLERVLVEIVHSREKTRSVRNAGPDLEG